jgi:hypothetical protein
MTDSSLPCDREATPRQASRDSDGRSLICVPGMHHLIHDLAAVEALGPSRVFLLGGGELAEHRQPLPPLVRPYPIYKSPFRM